MTDARPAGGDAGGAGGEGVGAEPAVHRRPWLPMLAPPVAWAVAFLFAFGFAEVACAADIAETRLAGVSVVRWAVLAAVAAAAAVALYTGRLSFRWWRELPGEGRGSARGTDRFAAVSGMLLSALFASGLLFLALTVPFAPPCLP